MTHFRAAMFVATASLGMVGSAVAAPGAVAAPASSAVQHKLCQNPYDYEIRSHSAYHIAAAGQSYKDGPGGTMQVSVSRSSTIDWTVGSSASVDVGLLFADVHATVSASVTHSTSITVGHTYTHVVPRGKYGHLVYGSWGYHVRWVEYHLGGSYCQIATQIAHGRATLPTNQVGWKWFVTNS